MQGSRFQHDVDSENAVATCKTECHTKGFLSRFLDVSTACKRMCMYAKDNYPRWCESTS
jgi:hypothetical protein